MSNRDKVLLIGMDAAHAGCMPSERYTVARAETVAIAMAAAGRFPAALQIQRNVRARVESDLEPAARDRESRRPWTERWPFRASSSIE